MINTQQNEVHISLHTPQIFPKRTQNNSNYFCKLTYIINGNQLMLVPETNCTLDCYTMKKSHNNKIEFF